MTHSLPFPLSTIPTNGEFGNRAAFRTNPHRGVDFSQLRGATGAIPAVIAGTVTINQWSAILGWVVEFEDANGKFWGYCHMAAQSPLPVGRGVGARQTVGTVGNTGKATTGAHLHMTLGSAKGAVFSGAVQDPIAYIQAKQKAEAVPTSSRTVGATNAKRRTTPTVAADNLSPNDLLTYNQTYEVKGYVTDLDPTKIIGGTNKWFNVGGLYSHASTFTDPSTTALTSLDPVVVPPTPTAGVTKAEVAALIAAIPKPPTVEQIAVEVIRQMHLPGN